MKKILSFVVFLVLSLSNVHSKVTLRIMNQCSHPVWPVTPSKAGAPSVLPTKGGRGHVLRPGQSMNISVPPSWSGSIWGRTKHSATGKFRSLIIEDSTGSTHHMVERGGGVGYNLQQPISTTIATLMFDGKDGLDHYEVSFRNGYNVPMTVVPVHTSGSGSGKHCMTAGCTVNLTSLCPPELRFSEESLGCKSACQAFGEPRFCCTSTNDTTPPCNPNLYTEFFKKACPSANSFVDDTSSLFSCPNLAQQDYTLIFCPSPSSSSSSTISNNLKLDIPAAILSILSLLVAVLSVLWWCFAGEGSICNNYGIINCFNCFNRN